MGKLELTFKVSRSSRGYEAFFSLSRVRLRIGGHIPVQLRMPCLRGGHMRLTHIFEWHHH